MTGKLDNINITKPISSGIREMELNWTRRWIDIMREAMWDSQTNAVSGINL